GRRRGLFEAMPVEVRGEPIGILPHSGDGLIAVGLVNPHRAGSANAMGVEEDHDLSDDFLGLPRLDHSLFAFGANPIEFSQAFGGLLNHVKHLLAKGLDEFFGEVWANAFDHAGAEILFDAFEGTGWDDS